MFGRKRDKVSDQAWVEITARYANLFVHCYKKRDITGMQVTVTALTHLCCALQMGDGKHKVGEQFLDYVRKEEGFPESDMPYAQWLVNHFFEAPQTEPAAFMLPWYQKLDDEWLIRQKLQAAFPERNSTELTAMLLHEVQKLERA